MLQDDKIKNFVPPYGDFEGLFREIAEIKVKGINFELKNKKSTERNQRIETIIFVYREIFDFPRDNREISLFVSKIFVTSAFD